MIEIKENEKNKWKLKEGEYLERTKKGNYRIIHPIRNEDGTINKKNLLIGGSWTNFIIMLWIIAMLLFLSWAYNHDIEQYQKIIEKYQENETTEGFIPFQLPDEIIIQNIGNLSKGVDKE